MKRFFTIAMIITVLTFVTLGVLNYLDIIKIKWTPLIILFSAVAPIFKLVSNWFNGQEAIITQIKQIHSNYAAPLPGKEKSNKDNELNNILSEIKALQTQIKKLEKRVTETEQKT